MTNPIISFIITNYNLPYDMLCECIDSILALSLSPSEKEIILVDDGSEKSFINELARYEKDIIYIRQIHKGLSAARNTGIQMAKGQYLQFVDGDDKMISSAYEHCLDIVRSKQPKMVIFDFTKSVIDKQVYTDSYFKSGCYYLRHNNIHGTAWGYIFQKSILSNLRFTEGIYHEDEEFTPLLLLRADNIYVTDAKAYFYRERPNSIVTNKDIRNKIKRLSDLKGVIIRLNIMADRMPVEEKNALQRRIAQLTMDYIYNIIIQTQSSHYLNRKTEELKRLGLYPLPPKDYTAKYTWFCRLSSSKIGLNILMRILPLMKEER